MRHRLPTVATRAKLSYQKHLTTFIHFHSLNLFSPSPTKAFPYFSICYFQLKIYYLKKPKLILLLKLNKLSLYF